MIVGVLAHEIGHVEKEHSLRQLYRAAGMAGLIMLIAGDVGAAGEDILTNGAALMSLSHSRDAESEADRISVELMAKAGRDPRAIGRFFARLEETLGIDGDSSFLSTHPGTAERRKAIDDHATAIGVGGPDAPDQRGVHNKQKRGSLGPPLLVSGCVRRRLLRRAFVQADLVDQF